MHHNAVIISNGLKYHGECVAYTTFIIIVFLKIWCVVIATCIYISRLCILCIYKAILIPKCLRYTITGISIYVYIIQTLMYINTTWYYCMHTFWKQWTMVEYNNIVCIPIPTTLHHAVHCKMHSTSECSSFGLLAVVDIT